MFSLEQLNDPKRAYRILLYKQKTRLKNIKYSILIFNLKTISSAKNGCHIAVIVF
jgi:hypothetical protein